MGVYVVVLEVVSCEGNMCVFRFPYAREGGVFVSAGCLGFGGGRGTVEKAPVKDALVGLGFQGGGRVVKENDKWCRGSGGVGDGSYSGARGELEGGKGGCGPGGVGLCFCPEVSEMGVLV